MAQRAHEMASAVLRDLRRSKRLPEDGVPTWDRVRPGERTHTGRVLAITPPARVMGRARGQVSTSTSPITLETYQRRNMTPEQRNAAKVEQYDGDGTVHGQRYGGKVVTRQPMPSKVVRGHMAQLALQARRERESR